MRQPGNGYYQWEEAYNSPEIIERIKPSIIFTQRTAKKKEERKVNRKYIVFAFLIILRELCMKFFNSETNKKLTIEYSLLLHFKLNRLSFDKGTIQENIR